ncbi:hypothetical protein KCU65_g7916, partial [Aureobasidium melanogenum]
MLSNFVTAIGLPWLIGSASAATCFSPTQNASLTVNVGYTNYQGYFDMTTNFFTWEGIQYGHVERFQQPTTPINLPAISNASTKGPICSKFSANGINSTPAYPGAEQCLFLNVYVPPELRCSNKSAPVFVWIHGGGYGYGYPDFAGQVTNAMGLDNGTTILVTIQYRLGIFGFLAGKEIHDNGNSNLGIYDQIFALKWINQNIASFGGDPKTVNGAHMYAGHLTHEGYNFVPHNISTMADLNAWFDSEYPLIGPHLRELVWQIYPDPKYSNGAYSTQAERAATLYGDWTFDCPAYGLASSFLNGTGWKYIDNVGTAYHGSDVAAWLDDPGLTYNGASDRNYILGSLTAFWQTWDPATNPAVASLGWMPFDKNSSHSQITHQLVNNSTNSSTFAYVDMLNAQQPERCTFLRAIGPQVPE